MLGIDVGVAGAIAILDGDTDELVDVFDMPVDKVSVAGKVRSRIARRALLDILLRVKRASAFIEQPEYRPMKGTNKATGQTVVRQMGVSGAGHFGESYGTVLMACTAADISLTEIRPGQWKRPMSVSSSKDDARRRALELFPVHASLFARKMDDGRAEAVLLGLYACRIIRGGHLAAITAA